MLRKLSFLIAAALTLAAVAIAQDKTGASGPARLALTELDAAYCDLAGQVRPAVVSIVAQQSFVGSAGKSERSIQLSGLVWDSSGSIVTLGRSLSAATSIEVLPLDGEAVKARLVGIDPETDIALLRAKLPGARPLAIGDPAALRPGSLVATVGNAFGLTGSFRIANIAGIGRRLTHGSVTFKDALEITAPVNPGDPGGLLANARGECVGLLVSSLRGNSEGLDRALSDFFARRMRGLTRAPKEGAKKDGVAKGAARSSFGVGAQGIGFAIPVTTIKAALVRIKAAASKPRIWLGVQVIPVPKTLARELSLESGQGVIVTGVVLGSPAQKSGLIARDVVLNWNDVIVKDIYQLRALVMASKPGDKIKLDLLRGKERRSIVLELGSR